MTLTAYKEHPLRESLSRILDMRKDPVFSIKEIAENETYVFARDKIFAISQCIYDLLNQTPAELTSLNALNQIYSNIQAPINELTAYVSNKNLGHLANAASQFEQNILPYMWAFMPITKSLNGKTFHSILDTVSKLSLESIQQINTNRNQLIQRIQEAEADVEKIKLKLDEISAGAARERAEAAASVAKLEQQYAQSEGARQTGFDASMTNFKQEFVKLTSEIEQSGSSIIDILLSKRDDAARIVQIVGNIGVTGNYQKIANSESTQANVWRIITLGFFSIGITIAIITFLTHLGDSLSPDIMRSVMIRLLYALVIAAPAWYTARESARHRSNADRARQTELELASLGPFLDALQDDKKSAIREKLAPLYFGRPIEPHTVEPPIDPKLIKETAVEVAKALKH